MQGMVRHSSAQGEKGGERLWANQHAYSSLTHEHDQGRLRVHGKTKWEELPQTAMEVTEQGNTWEPLRECFWAVVQYKMRQKWQTQRTKSQLCLVVIDAVFSAEKWRWGPHLYGPSTGPSSGVMTHDDKTPEAFHKLQNDIKLFVTMPLSYTSTCIMK